MDFKERIAGCFAGKNIGGTLGARYEGRRCYLELDFYDPVPSEPAPNDDLDLQLVWLDCVRRHGCKVSAYDLGQGWLRHIDGHPDEYGIALWNLKRGLKPPLTGVHNNCFHDGMGAAIRTEIWAALCGGDARSAAHYAYQDACVDHYGDGVQAAIFNVVLESHLLAGMALPEAIGRALSALREGRLKNVLTAVAAAKASGMDALSIRDTLIAPAITGNFTDCVANLAIVVMALLCGDGDFERSLLLAVNCGQDADCTAATVGACLGIIHGYSGIPGRWLEPIGDQIKVGDYIRNLDAPATISELVEELYRLRQDFASADLPKLDLPLQEDETADFSDAVIWRINGEPYELPGYGIPVGSIVNTPYRDIVLETRIAAEEDMTIRFMACANGINRFYFDGEERGMWACEGEIRPAPHLPCGGAVWPLKLEGGKVHEIKIVLWTCNARSEEYFYYAVTDLKDRHIGGISVDVGIKKTNTDTSINSMSRATAGF